MKSLSLNGAWHLYFGPEYKGKHDDYSEALLARLTCIDALVPGNVELDLVRAGLEGDPLFGLNSLTYAKYEYYQWVYVREFDVPADFDPSNAILRLDGVDTFADVYLNGVHLGACADMFIEHELDVSEALRPGQTNELLVHIHSAMNEARSHEYSISLRGTAHRNEICYLRKAPHGFGWDIMPRLVSAGLWKDVTLTERAATRFTEVYLANSELNREGMVLQYAYRFVTDHDTLEGFSVRVHGVCGDSTFEHQLPAHFISANHELFVQNPKLWWPKGMGDQPLYDVTVELIYHGEVVDVYKQRFGIRALRLERSFEGEQKFQFYVNNERFFAMGTNWVPLDALHSRDRERLPMAFRLLDESGCNMVRCWGGNVPECSEFFSLCDEKGILIWQDFPMGNTNYPQTAEFEEVLEKEISTLLRRIRNHPSLALYCTDNEVDLKNMGFHYPHYDARYNRIAYDMLRKIVQRHDPYRFLLCSSPEIPDGFNMNNVPEQHTWGARAYYKDDFYKHSTARFIGEAGYHGCPAPSNLKNYMPEDCIWPMDNDCWASHSTEDIRIETFKGGRNKLMASQVELLTGSVPEDFNRFALLSQISQAEAMKFFVERTRALKWRRSGIIWWNLIDGWPQISDSVVDYYGTRKLAFHYLRRSQQPVLVFCGENAGARNPLMAANDTREAVTLTYEVRNADTDEVLLSGETTLAPGETAQIGSIQCPASAQRLYTIRFTANGIEGANHYLTGFPPYDPDRLIGWNEIIRKLPGGFEVEL